VLRSGNLAVAPAQEVIRKALSRHRSWIESRLRVPWCATVCLLTDLPLSQVATRRVLAYRQQDEAALRISKKLLGRIRSVEIPGYEQPLLNARAEEDD